MTISRQLAPAGAPIGLRELTRAGRLTLSTVDAASEMRDAFARRFDVRHVFLASTGRAGLTLILKAMRRLDGANRDEVILPSYTCYSVAASAVKAGLRVRLVDVSPETLDYDTGLLRATDFTKVLAIVATNLYGIPNDLPALSNLARERGAFLVDDAAQSMGASIGGRLSGTWGEAGLYSLDKGKNVCAIDGGVVVTNSDDVASALEIEVGTLLAPSIAECASGVVKALAYSAFLRPSLYWIPNSIPQLELGTTYFRTDFPLERQLRPLTALGLVMLRRLDEFTSRRQITAAALLDALVSTPGIRPIRPHNGATAVYPRLPILIDDADARREALSALNARGIGATGSYPASLADVPELRGSLAGRTPSAAGGRYLAAHIVTLPTHAFVTSTDIGRIASMIASTAIDGPLAVTTSTT